MAKQKVTLVKVRIVRSVSSRISNIEYRISNIEGRILNIEKTASGGFFVAGVLFIRLPTQEDWSVFLGRALFNIRNSTFGPALPNNFLFNIVEC